jgi:tripartite-type tricarboxylate transporter receptor subunit TctC
VITRRTLLSSALIGAPLCALAAQPAAAQAYPSRPVKIIVPFAPGGVDVTARIVADRLAAALGQPFVVENRPGGAGGSVGAKAAASAEPDGYTLLFSTPGPSTISPAINKNAGYDVKSFAAVAIVSNSPIMLVVNPSVPAKTVPELIAHAKANPGQVRYPSPGYGTQPHLLGEMLRTVADAPVVHIPYRGSAPSITDLIAGQVHFYFDNIPNVLQQVRAGQLRAMALTTEARDPQFPELPTIAESGLKGFVATYWNGVLAPAGTPASIVAKLNAVINEALQSPEMQASLRRLGAEPKTLSPEEFAAFLVSESRKWADVAQAAGIKLE